jgi:hypothetical protein
MSSLTSIHIPSSVEVMVGCFSGCRSLLPVTFDAESKLSRLERCAFCASGLPSIHIPSSVEVIYEGCFFECRSLLSVTFDAQSKLSRLERRAFYMGAVCDRFTFVHLLK